MKHSKISGKSMLFLMLLLIIQLITAFGFGTQKTGYHYDEYYSYYSSNVSVGLGPFDRDWKTGQEIRDEFAVLPGETFNFPRVVQMQSYDVHPPVYYLFLHTLCSLVPGVFSKWTGIGLNMIFFMGSWLLLAWLAWHISGKKKEAAAVTCLLYGFNPAVISGIMLVRMYTMLGFWILAITCLHVSALEKRKRGGRFYLLLAVLTFLGFLTHYYFAVYLFFLAAAMEFYLLLSRQSGRTIKKRLLDCLVYGAVTVGAMLLAVICYPASASHIFRGYRGTEAMGAFFDLSNTLDRVRFFLGLLNEYAFGSMLAVYLLAVVLLGLTYVTLGRIRKRRGMQSAEQSTSFWENQRVRLIVAAATLGYFAVVAKTALLTAEEANRYQIPIYGLLLMQSVVLIMLLAEKVCRAVKKSAASGRGYVLLVSAVSLLLAAGQLTGLASGKVLFLYQEDAESIAFAQENQEETVVYLYNNNVSWMTWDDSLELMQYDEIYFVNLLDKEALQKTETFADERLTGADRILVYCMRNDNAQTALDALVEQNEQLTHCEKIRELLYCDLYELSGEK